MTGTNDALVTVNWPQAPVSRPESQLIGSTYQDVEASADMVVTDPSSWVLAGTGPRGRPAPAQGGAGRVRPLRARGAGPTNLDVIAHSIVPNRDGNYSDVTWYTVPGRRRGLRHRQRHRWVGQLANSPLVPSNVVPSHAPG